MKDKLPKIILWIQETPGSHKTVLSEDGVDIDSGTSKYITFFNALTEIDLDRYKVLTSSIKRYTDYPKGLKRGTLIAGHFQQTDESNRHICYRAFIINAKNREEECRLLEEKAEQYGCSISDEDRQALKKKSKISFLILVLIILIVICIWTFKSLKMF